MVWPINTFAVNTTNGSAHETVLSCLIWVQTVCKGYQQTTLGSKEFNIILFSCVFHAEMIAAHQKEGIERRKRRNTDMTGTERQNMDVTRITGEGISVVVCTILTIYKNLQTFTVQ